MKKTLDVNIGSIAFTINEDAYQTLSRYYDDIRSRLYETERQEVMDDVEARTADIFRENFAYPSQVVDVDLVKKAIATIGSAASFGEKCYDESGGYYEEPKQDEKIPGKLYRSRRGVIGGVCSGLAEYFNLDVALVRIVMLLLVFLMGMSALVYIILWIIIPMEPLQQRQQRYKEGYYRRKNERR